MTSKRLLITYSWSVNNIGDIAITPGLLKRKQDVLPELPVSLITLQHSDHPKFDFLQSYYPQYCSDCRVVSNGIHSLIGSGKAGKRRGGKAWRSLLSRWGENKINAVDTGCITAEAAKDLMEDVQGTFADELLHEMKEEFPDCAREFSDAGFVLFNSGTVMNFGRTGKREFWHTTLPMLVPLILARRLNIPYGTNSHSFDAIEWPADLLVRNLFKDAAFVNCRDTDSLEYLQQRHILNDDMVYGPDSTFFFSGADDDWLESYLTKYGMEKKNYVPLIIRTSMQAGPIKTIDKQREMSHMKKLRLFIEEWTRRTNVPVALVPEVTFEIQAAREYLLEKLSDRARKNTVWMDSFWTTEQAYSFYRNARFVVSMEMHSIIMAIGMGTPVLHPQFAESGRKARMVRDLGLGEWLFDIDEATPDELLDAAIDIHENYERSLEKVAAPLPRLKQLSEEMLKKVRVLGKF